LDEEAAVGRVIERTECEQCGEPAGVCACAAGAVQWEPTPGQVTRRYTDERYLLEMMKAARRVLHASQTDDEGGEMLLAVNALEAALLWCESDGMGPVALSGSAQLELDRDVPERGE
jgi:hypothetical protein